MEKKVISILEKFVTLEDGFNSSTTFTNISGWDSLKHVQFILDVENELKIKLTPEQLIACTSVDNILSIIAG